MIEKQYTRNYMVKYFLPGLFFTNQIKTKIICQNIKHIPPADLLLLFFR